MPSWFAQMRPLRATNVSWPQAIVMVTTMLIAARCFLVWVEVCRSDDIQSINRQQQNEKDINPHLLIHKKLAIVVSVHQEDKDRAIQSLQKWPSNCHPLTMDNVYVVIYQAESETSVDFLARVAEGPGKCFWKTSLVSGHLLPEVCTVSYTSNISKYARGTQIL